MIRRYRDARTAFSRAGPSPRRETQHPPRSMLAPNEWQLDAATDRAFRTRQANVYYRSLAWLLFALAALGALVGAMDYLRLDGWQQTAALAIRAVYVTALIGGGVWVLRQPRLYHGILLGAGFLASAVTFALLLMYDPEQSSVMGSALLFVFAALIFLLMVPSSSRTRSILAGTNLIAASIAPLLTRGSEPEGRVFLATSLAITCIVLLSYVARREDRLNRARFRALQALEFQASHDVLTELPNRRSFFADLEELETRYALPRGRAAQTAVLLAILDLDHFKNVNDQYGHDAGDHVLVAIAQRLRLHAPDAPTGELTDAAASGPVPLRAYRLGGEEFALLAEADRGDSFEPLLHRILDSVRNSPIRIGPDANISCRASCGATVIDGARYPLNQAHLRDALTRADQLLYRAKTDGRDQFRIEPYTGLTAAPIADSPADPQPPPNR